MTFRIDIHAPLARAGHFHELIGVVERPPVIRSGA